MPSSNTTIAKSAHPVRVALLTNILPNYRVALLKQLQAMVTELRIFLSARTESNRTEPVNWGPLDVCVQYSISWSRRFINVHGFEDVTHTHIPVDTYWQLSRYRPDVIITGEFGARTIFAVLYRTFHRKTRIILWATLSQRTEATRGGARNAVRRFLLRNVDSVFVNGADGEAYIRGMGFTGPLVAIPYVVDNAAFDSAPTVESAGDVITLFYGGQLIQRKGLLAFCESLSIWSQANPEVRLKFRIAGDGPLLPQLQAIAQASHMPIEFIGHLSVEGLAREYARASIYVFPTYADEWGVVVNEALSAGVPVMGSCHSQAVDELIRDGKNGWVFDPTDTQSTLHVFDRALKTPPAVLASMRGACRQSMREFTPEVVAGRMRDSVVALCYAARS